MNKLDNFSERLQKITFGQVKNNKIIAEEIWQDFYDKGNLDQINDDYAMDDYFDFYFKESPEITNKEAFKSNIIDILRDDDFNIRMLKENDDNPDLYYEMSESDDKYFSALLEDVEIALNDNFSEEVNFGVLGNLKSAAGAFKDTMKQGIENDRAKKGQDLKAEYDNISKEQKYIKVLIELFQDDAKNFPKGKKTFEKVTKLLGKIDGFVQKRLEKIAKNKKFKAADKQNKAGEQPKVESKKSDSNIVQMPNSKEA